MDSLITIVNKLQDVISTAGMSQKVNLPQIVVVGSQSSGKSSVLESVVGKSFLPRGIGIVTRTPLLLHLISQPENETGEWATFLHKPKKKYYDFDEVRKEIEERTKQIAGNNKGINEEPIVLNVYSKQLYNLSLVDLPGLTKNPVGDQPPNIEEIIKNLVLSYIKNPNSIILAVVTANTDTATSESLNIAREVDPEGIRTMAVVTKIDIMDAGTDANELLSGKAEITMPKLGIIGIVNRSQKDINEKKTIADSIENENAFFKRMYTDIANQHGTVVLGKKLQFLLIQKIKETFPSLKKELYEMHTEYGTKIRQFTEFSENYDQSLLNLITWTATSYKASLDGQTNNIGVKTLIGGAKIAHHFKYGFGKEMNKINPLKGFDTDLIINVIKNSSGTSMGVFLPEQAFVHLVRIQLQQMEGPSLNCVNIVHEELVQNIYNLEEDISLNLKKYPKFMETVIEILQALLIEYKQKTIKSVRKLIRYQEAFINTDHPDFTQAILQSTEYKELLKKAGLKKDHSQNLYEEINEHDSDISISEEVSMREVVEKVSTNAFSGCSKVDKLISENRARLLMIFIESYFKVIKKIILDTVPKTIMYEMVNNVKQNFQKVLISKVYKTKDKTELLLESTETKSERISATNQFEASEKALKLMREIEQLCQVSE